MGSIHNVKSKFRWGCAENLFPNWLRPMSATCQSTWAKDIHVKASTPSLPQKRSICRPPSIGFVLDMRYKSKALEASSPSYWEAWRGILNKILVSAFFLLLGWGIPRAPQPLTLTLRLCL